MESLSIMTPRNYSWISSNLAAMAFPGTNDNIQFLIKEGITHMVTLSPELIPPISKTDLCWHLIPIEDLEPPTVEDISKFIDICKTCKGNNHRVAVHCRTGRGRTGVMAACYLLYFNKWRPERSITTIRIQRPGSIETYEQERSVFKYYDHLMSDMEYVEK